MKLTVTLRELTPIIQSLNNFVQVPIPARYSWRLGKVMKKLQAEIEEFNASKNELFRKYGEEVQIPSQAPGMPAGRQMRIREEHMTQFTSELDELLSESVTINFDPIPISLVENSEMSIADMANLEAFFEDDSASSSDNSEEVSEELEDAPSNI